MIHLANNYNYRFLNDNTKVFTVTKQKQQLGRHIIQHPQRLHYYTEAYLSRDNQEIRNALLGFAEHQKCVNWHGRICRVEKQIQYPKMVDVNLDNIPEIRDFSLKDMKYMSDLLHMPLIVIISEDINTNEYSVFYYRHKVVQWLM
jgi:hypothetical protein